MPAAGRDFAGAFAGSDFTGAAAGEPAGGGDKAGFAIDPALDTALFMRQTGDSETSIPGPTE